MIPLTLQVPQQPIAHSAPIECPIATPCPKPTPLPVPAPPPPSPLNGPEGPIVLPEGYALEKIGIAVSKWRVWDKREGRPFIVGDVGEFTVPVMHGFWWVEPSTFYSNGRNYYGVQAAIDALLAQHEAVERKRAERAAKSAA